MYPWAFMARAMPLLGRSAFADNPTTAMCRNEARMFSTTFVSMNRIESVVGDGTLPRKIPVSQDTNNVRGKNNYYLGANLWSIVRSVLWSTLEGLQWGTLFFKRFIVWIPVFILARRIWPLIGN